MINPITPQGFKALQEELNNLIMFEREKNLADISEARARGDLSENAEYHAAKETQKILEHRIQNLKNILINSSIFNCREYVYLNKVIFGTTVRLLEKESNIEYTYKLVSTAEVSVYDNGISIHSPLGVKLIGMTNGDTILINSDKRTTTFVIQEILFES